MSLGKGLILIYRKVIVLLWFGGLLLSLIIVILLILRDQWFCLEWERSTRMLHGLQLLLPWVPAGFLLIYVLMYPIRPIDFKAYFGICSTFGLLLTGVNIYRTLWSVLYNLQLKQSRLGPGRLLLKISTAVALTITALISLFALAYANISFLAGFSGDNYVMEGGLSPKRIEPGEIGAFFYFSSVTYFSLGYGDYLPRGTLMILMIYLESLLGYINSGILIAYAFNLFTKLNR